MARYTVFGGRGFIGQEIVNLLRQQNHEVWVPARVDKSIFEKPLGLVIYCAGNGDCQQSPFEVFTANAMLLAELLKSAKFERLVYVSSTRVYMNGENTNEDADLLVCNDDARRLFNLTKLLAEELCHKSGRDTVIVRPSNVYGVALNSPLFLPSISRNAINNMHIDMYIAPEYAKDYVAVEDVAFACVQLSQNPEALNKTYNIAAGYNITAEEIAKVLVRCTGCTVTWHDRVFPREVFPVNEISNLTALLADYKPRNVLEDVEEMVYRFKEQMERHNE